MPLNPNPEFSFVPTYIEASCDQRERRSKVRRVNGVQLPNSLFLLARSAVESQTDGHRRATHHTHCSSATLRGIPWTEDVIFSGQMAKLQQDALLNFGIYKSSPSLYLQNFGDG